MNVKKNGKIGYKKGGLWNRLHGISIDFHGASQANVNGFGDANSQLFEENTRKLEVAAVLALAQCRMEGDRLRFTTV